MVDHGFEMVRYADDFVIQCRSAEEAGAALKLVQQWTTGVSLTLYPEKTKIVHARESEFDFLGDTFRSHKGRILRLPRKKSEAKLRESIRR
jgi:RNA-directed DNA polymerase